MQETTPDEPTVPSTDPAAADRGGEVEPVTVEGAISPVDAPVPVHSTIEKAIADKRAQQGLDQYIKVSFADVLALGGTLASFIPLFRTATTIGTYYTPGNLGQNEVLRQAKNGQYYGSAKKIDGGNKFVTGTRWRASIPGCQ